MSIIASSHQRIIIGLGKTGLATVRFFVRKGWPVVAMDTREDEQIRDQVLAICPDAKVYLGPLDEDRLLTASELVVSPGLNIQDPAIRAAAKAGARVRGDIDLFKEEVTAPIVAITGSNAKSTVTTLVGEMAKACGKHVVVAGNIGLPVLDAIDPKADLYVLELSSFQLETTYDLGAEVATVLNISEDHMDRYDSLLAYQQAKHRIFQGARQGVVYDQDPLTQPLVSDQFPMLKVGLRQEFKTFSLADGHLCFEFEPWLPLAQLAMKGRHNAINALHALALGHSVGLDKDPMVSVLKEFKGLEHRCEFVATLDGVHYINDSKGTNVGATLAALQGLGNPEQPNLILLAGGVGKGADFRDLARPVQQLCRQAILFGQDRDAIAQALPDHLIQLCDTLEQALEAAKAMATSGNTILLSPACASFDQFSGFEHRGRVFKAWVEAQ